MSVKRAGHVRYNAPATLALGEYLSRRTDDAIFMGSCGRCPRTGRVGSYCRAGAARCAARRRSASATAAEPAGPAEGYAAGAGRPDHAELQRRARRDLQSLSRVRRSERSDERLRGRYEANQDRGASDDDDGTGDQSDRTEVRALESGGPGCGCRMRHVPSRRGDSGCGTWVTWCSAATARRRAWRPAAGEIAG